MHILYAFLVGLVSLGLQFVFNRLIFFYIVNTDYATVSVISLHLIGFFDRSPVGNAVSSCQSGHPCRSLL